MDNKTQKSSRREFMKNAAFTTATFMIVTPQVLGREGKAPSDQLNIAAIGVGGRGADNLRECESENFVAFADVDDKRAEKTFIRYETVPKYKDYRKMLDRHEKEIDAVIVATPDHTHAVCAMEAIQRGKHVYLEKPLAHSIYEVRALMKAAQEQSIITQLGNQGHSFDDIRKICEWVWDGAIGPVTEVYAWFDHPYGNGKKRPEDTPPVPETLDWELWLGPAPYRPYHSAYVPGSWRSWADFGTGVLGDWVCHVLDPTFWALKLHAPTKIQANNAGGEYSPERFPLESTIQYDFPAREGMPPVKVTWMYGRDADHPLLENVELSDWNKKIGVLLIGEKGCILHGSHGGGGARIIPDARDREYKKPEPTLPRVPGGHQQDWIRACKAEKPAGSDFSYGGPLTELALLGVIATVLDGETLEWDSREMKFKNSEQANSMLKPTFREGWTL